MLGPAVIPQRGPEEGEERLRLAEMLGGCELVRRCAQSRPALSRNGTGYGNWRCRDRQTAQPDSECQQCCDAGDPAERAEMTERAQRFDCRFRLLRRPHGDDPLPHRVPWRLGRVVILAGGVAEKIVPSIVHHSQSFAKSARASRSRARARNSCAFEVPGCTPRELAISSWVYPST